MDLRNLPQGLSPQERVYERRMRIEKALKLPLSNTHISTEQIAAADEKNCEQMFGAVPIPVGLAGALRIQFSSDENLDAFVPLATTEGALVASVNRGAKALYTEGIRTSSKYVGISRSIAFFTERPKKTSVEILKIKREWIKVAEATSGHLKIISHSIDYSKDVLFLTVVGHTDEAMGMNMITIAAQAAADYISEKLQLKTLTIAANLDSDKKPSLRTKKLGRGFRAKAEAFVSKKSIEEILKSDTPSLLATARAKLEIGSKLAGALGSNLHVANVAAAIYLATGQDVAHIVEASLADTKVTRAKDGIKITVELPAVLVGTRGGGTDLPSQKQCLRLILNPKTTLKPTAQLAETVAAAVLAGELSLLAAQASNSLAKAHKKLARKS